MDREMTVLTFEGPTVLYVHPSVADAEGHFEAIDVECDEYVFFGDDGTVLGPSVRDGRVVLTPTGEDRSEDLRERLRTYLARSGLALDPALANDTVALADVMLEQERAHSRTGWLGRLRTRRCAT